MFFGSGSFASDPSPSLGGCGLKSRGTKKGRGKIPSPSLGGCGVKFLEFGKKRHIPGSPSLGGCGLKFLAGYRDNEASVSHPL